VSARIIILASGEGSLAQAIIDAQMRGTIDASIVAVISDRPDVNVLGRAQNAGIPTFVQPMSKDRKDWNHKFFQLVDSLHPDLVVSAGFMRILSPEFVYHFKYINTHPALLPLFPGAHAVRDALQAGAKVTGATVHWVDTGVDTGEIIRQTEVVILPNDDEASLHERIKIVERGLIVATIQELLPTLESRHA
jgi:phosphoribosylglycinamide formyltransferase-1